MLERLPIEEGMPGYYYAHVPSLSLTTHGLGMEGALEAARDLVKLWNEEKLRNLPTKFLSLRYWLTMVRVTVEPVPEPGLFEADQGCPYLTCVMMTRFEGSWIWPGNRSKLTDFEIASTYG